MNKRLRDFFFLCRCLQPQRDATGTRDIERMLLADSVCWERVIEYANRALIAPALWSTFVRKGLQDSVPHDVADYLSELHRLNQSRNDAIRVQLTEITHALNLVGVEPLLLKGAALLFTDALPDPGWRMMTDIDMLVREESLTKVRDTLTKLRYEFLCDDEAEFAFCQHLAPLVREGAPASIEVHTKLAHDYDHPEILTASDVWRDSLPARINGLSWRILSPSHFVMYNFVHSEIHHEHFHHATISLRDLLDLPLIHRVYQASFDWSDIRSRLEKHGLWRAFRSYQYMALKLLGTSVYEDIDPRSSDLCHYWRCLFVLGWPRLQTFFQFGVARRVVRLFERDRMQRRFGCSDSASDLARTRIAYAWFLFMNFVLGPKRHMLVARLRGKNPNATERSAKDPL